MAQLASNLPQKAKQRLEDLVVAELRRSSDACLGAVQMLLAKKHRPKQPAAHKSAAGQIFGRALDGQDIEQVSGCGPVPRFLVSVRNLLENHLDVEGIFRKAGSSARVKGIRAAVDQGDSIPGITQAHDLADIVKQYFRELPEPLFTTQYSEAFLQVASEESEAVRTRCLQLLCLLLPSVHLATLTFFMSLLADFGEHCQNNKMEPHNLALCVSPNLFYLSEDDKSFCNKNKQRTQVVQDLISIARNIGFVPEYLEESLNARGERLGEKAATPEHGRKRRRRGSLDGMKAAVRRSLDSIGLIFRPGHSRRNSATGIPLQPGHVDVERPSAADMGSFDDPSHQPLSPKRRDSLGGDGDDLALAPAVKKRKLLVEYDHQQLPQEDQSLMAIDDVKSSGSTVSSRFFKSFGMFSRKRSPSPAASSREHRQDVSDRVGRRGAASPVSSCPVSNHPVGRRLASELTRGGLVHAESFPIWRPDSRETVAAECRSGCSNSASSPPSLDRRVASFAADGLTVLPVSQTVPPIMMAPQHQAHSAAGQLLASAAGNEQGSATVPHLLRAQVPVGRCAAQLLPSRLRPVTPTGSGRLKIIDKAQISAPILLSSAADYVENSASQQDAGPSERPGCRLLDLSEAAAAGIAKPSFSPPESPAIFERVRSFRRHDGPVALRVHLSQVGSVPSTQHFVGTGSDGDSSRSCGTAAVNGTALLLPDRLESVTVSDDTRESHRNLNNCFVQPAETSLQMTSLPQSEVTHELNAEQSCTNEHYALEPSVSCGHREDSDAADDRESQPVAFIVEEGQRSLNCPAPMQCPTGCGPCDPSTKGRREKVALHTTGSPETFSRHNNSSTPSEMGKPLPAVSPAVSQPERLYLPYGSMQGQHERVQLSTLPASDASTPGHADSSDGQDTPSCFVQEPRLRTDWGGLGHSPRTVGGTRCLPSTSGGTSSAGKAAPASTFVAGIGRLQVIGSSSEQRPAAGGQRQSLLYLRDAALVRRCLRGDRDFPQTLTVPAGVSSNGRCASSTRDDLVNAIDSRTSPACRARAPYRQPAEAATRRLPQRLPPSLVFSSDIGDRRQCIKVVEGILQGQHDDIVSRHAGDSGATPARLVTVAENLPAELEVDNTRHYLETKASLLRPPLRESNAELPSFAVPHKPAVQLPRIKDPILPIDVVNSRTRMSFSSGRQVKRLTNNSPRSPGLGRIASSVPVSCQAPRPGGSPLRPIPCRLSVRATCEGAEHDTLV